MLKSIYKNYATKAYLKSATGVNTSQLVPKSDLASLEAEIDEIDVDKLKPVPANLSKLSTVVNNDLVKKTVCDKLIAKVNNIETSAFVLKTKYDIDKSDLEKKIPDISRLVKKTNYNAKIIEIEGKIPSISCSATTSRGGSRTAATSKMEHFVIINNGWQPLTIITKSSILDVAAVLDPPLTSASNAVANEILDISDLVKNNNNNKKQIMIQKHQPLNVNILIQLITINLLIILLLIK